MYVNLAARGVVSLVCQAFRSSGASTVQRTPQAPPQHGRSRARKAPMVPLQAQPFAWPPPMKRRQPAAAKQLNKQRKQQESPSSSCVPPAAVTSTQPPCSQQTPLPAAEAEAAALMELEEAIRAISNGDISSVAPSPSSRGQQVVVGLPTALQERMDKDMAAFEQMLARTATMLTGPDSQQLQEASDAGSSGSTTKAALLEPQEPSRLAASSSRLELQAVPAVQPGLQLLLDQQSLLLQDNQQQVEEITSLKAQLAIDRQLISALKKELQEAKAALASKGADAEQDAEQDAEHDAADSSAAAQHSAVEVEFGISCATRFGECLLLVGDHPALGSWCLDRALQLEWSAGHIWCGSACLGLAAAGQQVAYKAVLKRADGSVIWTAGADWTLGLADGSTSAVHQFDFN